MLCNVQYKHGVIYVMSDTSMTDKIYTNVDTQFRLTNILLGGKSLHIVTFILACIVTSLSIMQDDFLKLPWFDTSVLSLSHSNLYQHNIQSKDVLLEGMTSVFIYRRFFCTTFLCCYWIFIMQNEYLIFQSIIHYTLELFYN